MELVMSFRQVAARRDLEDWERYMELNWDKFSECMRIVLIDQRKLCFEELQRIQTEEYDPN